MSFMQIRNNMNSEPSGNSHYYPCYAPVPTAASAPFGNFQSEPRPMNVSSNSATMGNHFYQAFTNNLNQNALNYNSNAMSSSNSTMNASLNNGNFAPQPHSNVNATNLAAEYVNNMVSNTATAMPNVHANLNGNNNEYVAAAAVCNSYVPHSHDATTYRNRIVDNYEPAVLSNTMLAACDSNTSSSSHTSNSLSYNSSTNTSSSSASSASAMDESFACGGASGVEHSFASSSAVKQETAPTSSCCASSNPDSASCACCCCVPMNCTTCHHSNQLPVAPQSSFEYNQSNQNYAAMPVSATAACANHANMNMNMTTNLNMMNVNSYRNHNSTQHANNNAHGTTSTAVYDSSSSYNTNSLIPSATNYPAVQSAANCNQSVAANLTQIGGNDAFIKDTQFVYPCYKQKYVLNGTAAANANNTRAFSMSRHHHHHRKQMKRESIMECVRAENTGNGNGNGNENMEQWQTVDTAHSSQPGLSNTSSNTSISMLSSASVATPSMSSTPLIEIKIKGNNLESLLKKLVKHGDDTYSCIECKKCFFQRCHLLRHIREMHLVKSTVHECPFCHKSFHQKSNLDTHCMTHAKDRKFSHPFKCLLCLQQGKEKCFTRKSSLKRHCQTKHKDESLEADWINAQQTPKWDAKRKTFVFATAKKKLYAPHMICANVSMLDQTRSTALSSENTEHAHTNTNSAVNALGIGQQHKSHILNVNANETANRKPTIVAPLLHHDSALNVRLN